MTGSIAHRNLSSPRVPALAGIVTLHVLIAYLLLTALVQRPSIAPPPTTTVTFAPDPAPAAPVTPVQPGATADKKITLNIPIPDPLVTPPAQPEPQVPAGPLVPPGPAPVAPEASIRLIGKHWLPNSEDYYPPDLIRIGVQGHTQVRVCVDEAGRASGAPVVEQSSGNARLDQGALNVARAGRYARSVRGDTPVPNCYHFRIVFKVK